MADEGDSNDEQAPHLRVVSDNPNARADRQAAWAKDEVERTLAHFAAALLRTMAGSNTEARYLMHRLSDFLDSLQQFRKETGARPVSRRIRDRSAPPAARIRIVGG